MNYHIEAHDTFSFGIVTHTEPVVAALISIDLHQENSLTDQALFELYSDALLSGAGKHTRDSFLHAVNSLGASINISLKESMLTISLRSTTVTFPKLLKLFAVMLQTPTFATTEISRIKAVTKNALHAKQEDSRTLAHEGLCNALYGTKDRRHSTATSALTAAIEKITKRELTVLHTRTMHTYWTCTIAGDAKSATQLAKTITSLKKGSVQTKTAPSTHNQKAPKADLKLSNIPSRSNIDFSLGTPVPITSHHPDYLALQFAVSVLAIPGFAGRLMNTVRDKEGLTYGIYGYAEGFSGSEQGYVRIMTFFNPLQTLQGLTSTYRELKKLYEKGVTAKEFNTFQTIFDTKQTLLQDSPLRQLGDLHGFNQNGFSVEEITEYKAKLKQLTRKQVNEVIKKYLNPSEFIISGAGPIESVRKDLQRFMQTK